MSWTYFDRGLRLWKGDALQMLKRTKSNSISGVVTDPPYGISFMGSRWDYDLPDIAIWQELHRVLKPGGYIVVFSSTRTIHRLGVALEDSGFEPRDLIGWVTYQGFPKSRSIADDLPEHDAKKYEGYGTALKPAQEPALLMRKPPEGTLAQNVLRYGTGGLNIDRCRFKPGDPAWIGPSEEWSFNHTDKPNGVSSFVFKAREGTQHSHPLGRWPANLYQCPKVSRTEREQYTEGLKSISGAQATHRKEGSAGLDNPRAGASRGAAEVRNSHPTVKPRQLIRWLLRLVSPPGDMSGPILDPFLGSGTALLAGLEEGIRVWGSEREEEYQRLIQHRVEESTRQGYLF